MTAPLVDPDVDLRGFDFVPLYWRRLFGSRFNNLASDAEFRAGHTLWFISWEQIPAGSLPNDDRELCTLAGLGRDMRQWRKVKKWALHNWKLCDHGRLYHPVVADLVNEAWQRTEANRHRTKAASKARWENRNGERNGSVTDSTLHYTTQDSSTPKGVSGRARGRARATPGFRDKSPVTKLYEGALDAADAVTERQEASQPGDRRNGGAAAKPLLDRR
jgi:hypothetical protein